MPRMLNVALIVLASLMVVGALVPPHPQVPGRENIVLSHVTVLNPGVSLQTDQTVVIASGRIVEVRASRPDDPETNCLDCWVMPGLIDAHVHTPPRVALGMQEAFSWMYLAHGVTSVRDTGQSDETVPRLRDRIAQGHIAGPNMLTCGPVLEGEPQIWNVGDAIVSARQARARVSQLAAQGVDCIKVYNTLGPEVFQAIAETTREHALPLIGHVPHAVGLHNVETMNVQHVTGIPYAFGRPTPVIKDWNSEDVLAMSDAELADVVALARRNRLSFTPTLINSHRRLVASDPVRWPRPASFAVLPEFFETFWNVGMGHPAGEAEISTAEQELPRLREIAAALQAAGVPVLAGTDVIMPWVTPGDALLAEVELLARAFGDNEAALAAATTLSGQHLAPGDIGVIMPGARADLLVYQRDPRLDLSRLSEWDMLIADGRRYTRSDVEMALDRFGQYDRSAIYSAVMGLAISLVTTQYSVASEEAG